MSEDNGKQYDGDIPVETLTALRSGESPFRAWKKVRLLVTRGDRKVYIEVPIKSIGLAEVMEQISKGAPLPPKKLIKKNSSEGRDAGYSHDTLVEDFTDEEYQKRVREHDMNASWKMVLAAWAVDIWDGEKKVVQANDEHSPTIVHDEDKAILILKKSGMTGEHLLKLVNEVRALTHEEQEKVEQDSPEL